MGLKNLIKMPKLPKFKDLAGATKSEAIALENLPEDLSEKLANELERPLLAWQAPQYIRTHKPVWWYVAASMLVLGLFFYGIWSGGWTFSVAVVLFAGVYYIFLDQEPPVYEVKITEMGVRFGRKFYPYSMFKTFWVDYHLPHTRDLHLIPNNNYKYELTINLMEQNPVEVKAVLRRFLPEWVDRRKTFTESIIKISGL
ncbi:hypothetical protein KA036_00480 [Candidatus Gracilibacteria bacterium]|jgi:hypothetical protein|nr:hypothetical protein [Candidatus Gracilibacteria bacterium]